MLRQMTSAQFGEWLAFYSVDPFDEDRADQRIARLATALGNLWIAKGQKFRLEDFLPYREQREQTDAEIYHAVQAVLDAKTDGHHRLPKHRLAQ